MSGSVRGAPGDLHFLRDRMTGFARCYRSNERRCVADPVLLARYQPDLSKSVNCSSDLWHSPLYVQ